jgi:hypothetical protein
VQPTLLQALWYRHEVVGDVDRADVKAAALQALGVISPDKDPARRSFVEYVLRDGTRQGSSDGGLPAPIDELVDRYGRSSTLVMAINAIAVMKEPAEALAIVDSVRHVAIDHGDPELYELLLSVEFRAIEVGLAPDITEAKGSFERRLRRLHRRARKERWSEDRLHAALVRLAYRTQYEDLEGRGLQVLAEVQQSSSTIAQERKEALACLGASLTLVPSTPLLTQSR